jgi:hypothetical protein
VGIRGNEIADELVRESSALTFLGPEPALGVSKQVIQQKLNHWLVKQHRVGWQSLGGTQRQARELISGTSLGIKGQMFVLY